MWPISGKKGRRFWGNKKGYWKNWKDKILEEHNSDVKKNGIGEIIININ